ncbi:hypothetical protein HAPAU_41750 [Halalkalicoccus paucihalophilus]|uniref:Uncharacterized protein n=1 Tax=Halalkalicoccus paucihalophilus TaxID=1008153 RepID=A0A151A8T1_9EURY|nr:hypothetical protein HAPAU_41750 [Halalkalicoccus paucihalophilus]
MGENKNETQRGGHRTVVQTLWLARSLGVSFLGLLT